MEYKEQKGDPLILFVLLMVTVGLITGGDALLAFGIAALIWTVWGLATLRSEAHHDNAKVTKPRGWGFVWLLIKGVLYGPYVHRAVR